MVGNLLIQMNQESLNKNTAIHLSEVAYQNGRLKSKALQGSLNCENPVFALEIITFSQILSMH